MMTSSLQKEILSMQNQEDDRFCLKKVQMANFMILLLHRLAFALVRL